MSKTKMDSEQSLLQQFRKSLANQFGTSFARKASNSLCMEFGRTFRLEGSRSQNIVLEMNRINLSKDESTPVGLKDETLTSSSNKRRERIIEMRERFQSDCKTVMEELIRTDTKHEACWLNQTVLATAAPGKLSEIAGAHSVVTLDVPRKIEIEEQARGLQLCCPGSAQMYGRTGKDIAVALIDTEVKMDHPALTDRVIQKRRYTREAWGKPHWHATAVAGILGGRLNTFWGAAPECMILNYKVIGTESSRDDLDFYGSRAIQDALEDGAHVANCSWGAGPISDGMGREALACDNAWMLGMAVVKSSGNGSDLTTPADARGVIVVGASNVIGSMVPNYSGRGVTVDGRFLPHLVAPGGTDEDQVYSLDVNNSVDEVGCGTSYAAPWVTGTITRLLESRPQLGPDSVRVGVLSMCTLIPGVDARIQGAGILDIRRPIH